MPRIQPIDPSTAPAETQQTLETVKARVGRVPNLVATLANAPAALNGYLGFGGGIAQGTIISAQLKEQIALTVAEANGCEYCLSAHTMLGKKQGLSDDDILGARAGNAGDPASDAALKLARAIVEKRGKVSDADVSHAREAGLSDAQIVEITVQVAYNILTNYINEVSKADIDFPRAQPLGTAAD